MIPGEYFLGDSKIEINKNIQKIEIEVRNDGDRPIQIGSHFHFSSANSALKFDRELAAGKRLDIPSGTAIRFEPGQTKTVALIPLSATIHDPITSTPHQG